MWQFYSIFSCILPKDLSIKSLYASVINVSLNDECCKPVSKYAFSLLIISKTGFLVEIGEPEANSGIFNIVC